MNPFEVMIYNLNSLGFYGFVLPWVFIFAVMYALLLKSEILGKDQKIIGVVSLVVAFLVASLFAPLGMVLSNLFGVATLFLAGILVVILLASMAGFNVTDITAHKSILAILIGIGVVIFLSFGLSSIFEIRMSEGTIAAVFMVIVMIAAVYFIAGKSG